MRKAWVYINGEAIPKEDYEAQERARGHLFVPDLPDFVSPIDGQRYSGRAGLREHCAKHNVVPTEDLRGLPPKTLVQEVQRSHRDVERNKRTIAEILNSKGIS
jgi:hypothetical protein